MRGPALDAGPRLVDTQAEVEEVACEVPVPVDRHPEPLDRAPRLDDGAALLPIRTLDTRTELVLAHRLPETAPLRAHPRDHAPIVLESTLRRVDEAADRGCGKVRIA